MRVQPPIKGRWEAWRQGNRRRNACDLRVQAIRCQSCNRLRAHIHQDDPRTWQCGCGGLSFVSTAIHPDEEETAKKLYRREIEANNVTGRVAKELLDDWRSKYGIPGDSAPRLKVYSG